MKRVSSRPSLYTVRASDSQLTRDLIKCIECQSLGEHLMRTYLWVYPIYWHPNVSREEWPVVKHSLDTFILGLVQRHIRTWDAMIDVSRGEMELPPNLNRPAVMAGIQWYATGECPYWEPTGDGQQSWAYAQEMMFKNVSAYLEHTVR